MLARASPRSRARPLLPLRRGPSGRPRPLAAPLRRLVARRLKTNAWDRTCSRLARGRPYRSAQLPAGRRRTAHGSDTRRPGHGVPGSWPSKLGLPVRPDHFSHSLPAATRYAVARHSHPARSPRARRVHVRPLRPSLYASAARYPGVLPWWPAVLVLFACRRGLSTARARAYGHQPVSASGAVEPENAWSPARRARDAVPVAPTSRNRAPRIARRVLAAGENPSASAGSSGTPPQLRHPAGERLDPDCRPPPRGASAALPCGREAEAARLRRLGADARLLAFPDPARPLVERYLLDMPAAGSASGRRGRAKRDFGFSDPGPPPHRGSFQPAAGRRCATAAGSGSESPGDEPTRSEG